MKSKLMRIVNMSVWLVGAFCSVSAVKGANHIYLLAGGENALGAMGGAPFSGEQISECESYSYLWNGNMNSTGGTVVDNPGWSVVGPQPLGQKSGVLSMGGSSTHFAITVGGKPAQLTRQEEGSYIITEIIAASMKW